MQPFSGNQRPDLLISLMHMSLVLRLPREMHLSRSSSNVPRPPSFSDMPQNPHVLLTWQGAESLTPATQNHIFKSGPKLVCFAHFDFDMCFVPQQRCTFPASQHPKVLRPWCVLHILTSKCASRHNDVHFFDISTSKSTPRMVCFVHFDLEICFAPQRRALFLHRSFQKCSEREVFLVT